MASLEGSFFTGLDVSGGSPSNFPIPANEIVFGTGPGVTSDSNFIFTHGVGQAGLVEIDGVDENHDGEYSFLATPGVGNNRMSWLAQEFSTSVTRTNFVSSFGYNPELVVGDHALFITTESYFVPVSDGQAEWHLQYFNPAHTMGARIISASIPVEGAFADEVSLLVGAKNFSIASAPTTSDTVNVKFLASALVDTGTGGNFPSDLRIRVTDASVNSLDFRINAPYIELDARNISGGGGLNIQEPLGASNLPILISDSGGSKFIAYADGSVFLARALLMNEITAPGAPPVNQVYIYLQDNGAGKTQLMALFNTGAAQQIAIQP